MGDRSRCSTAVQVTRGPILISVPAGCTRAFAVALNGKARVALTHDDREGAHVESVDALALEKEDAVKFDFATCQVDEDGGYDEAGETSTSPQKKQRRQSFFLKVFAGTVYMAFITRIPIG